MKLIHCADIHLDACMSTHLTSQQANVRKAELLQTFLNMIEYAEQEQVKAILIAGDLFDTEIISAETRESITDAVRLHPQISFFYLRGNHDSLDCMDIEELPENFYTFTDRWQSYALTEEGCRHPVVINGVELNAKNADSIYDTLHLETEPFQIVMLHGQLVRHDGEKNAEQISLSALAQKQIDYLALGHIHKQQTGQIDGRGTYCYSGCLEGRGFDECGPHGFMLLDIDADEHSCKVQFHPFAKRQFHWITADVSGCLDSLSIEKKVQQTMQSEAIAPADFVRVELMGEIPIDAQINMTYLQQRFAEQYFYLEFKDHTTFEVDAKTFALDASLKGEFVRMVSKDQELSDETKAEVIRMGLQFLTGMEPEF